MHPKRLPNVSYDGSPARFLADSPHLVLLDPIALDDLRPYLEDLPAIQVKPPGQVLLDLSEKTAEVSGCLGFAYHEIQNFRPGLYQLQAEGVCKFGSEADGEDEDWDEYGSEADGNGSDHQDYALRYFGVDSGAFVVACYAHLARLSQLLTYEQYDLSLQAPPGGEEVIRRISESLGGDFFAIVYGVETTEFDGDGMYTLREGAIKPV